MIVLAKFEANSNSVGEGFMIANEIKKIFETAPISLEFSIEEKGIVLVTIPKKFYITCPAIDKEIDIIMMDYNYTNLKDKNESN